MKLNIFSRDAMRPFVDERDGTAKIIHNAKILATNAVATLRYQDWLDIDNTVVAVATQRLVGIRDLISRGLVRPLGNIGITKSMFQRSSDMTAAQITMGIAVEGERDRVNFDTQDVPVPVVSKDFEYDARELAASAAHGSGLDTDTVAIATRQVAQTSEDMLFSGSAVKVDGTNAVYGYLTHPDRNTVDLSKNWTANDKTGAEILVDVQAMLAAARADLKFGPFVLYIPGAYETVLDNDYVTGATDRRTIRERIMQLNGISAITVADRMPANNVVLVSLERETVDLAMGQDISAIQYEVQGGLLSKFKVLAIWAPRIKSDFDGRCGVVHLRAA